MMNAANIIAILTAGATAITIAVSLFSLQTARTAERTAQESVRTAQESDRHERMPVLVCPSHNGRITVRNLGKGPALNVAIARAGKELADKDALELRFDQLERTLWSEGRHLQPIEPGATVAYEWQGGPAVGLSYTDALGVPYTTLASEYGTKVFNGSAMKIPLSKLAYPRRVTEC